ncbi:MAG: iron-sulfur cluster assembly scaffold protein, partial [Planctomycetota bacterium]
MDHFHNARNVGSFDASDPAVGTAARGEDECGDVVKMQVRIVDGAIAEARFKTFGCTAAIAASSLVTVLAEDLAVERVGDITPQQVSRELEFSADKTHGSELAVGALQAAVEDYKQKRPRSCCE